jgi:hypothetical protein
MTLEETFERLGLKQIERYLQDRAQEHLQLEFKALKNSFLDREDRKIFAQCISGFANASGGIIVWGVDARKQDDGVDCAGERKEFEQLELFVSKLNEFTGQAVFPVVDGVRHKAIETDGGHGFAATIVPESDSGPHMAKLGEDRYYKRSGTSFLKMEHFDLEDMFGRRQRPKLDVLVKNEVLPEPNVGQEALKLSIVNQGRALARFIGVVVKMTNVEIKAVEGFKDFTKLNQGDPTVSYTNNVDVFHPNGVSHSIGSVSFRRLNVEEPVIVTIMIDCENMRTRNGAFSVPPVSR